MDFHKFTLERDLVSIRESVISEQIAEIGGQPGAAPDFLIIGAPRAGTTWLARVLEKHPGVYVSPYKELKFFSSMFLRLGLDWYLRQFESEPGRLRGEATPAYATLPLARIKLIHAMNPGLKIFYIVREPEERIISSCQYSLPDIEQASPDAIISYAFSDGPVAGSDYDANLRRWRAVFPGEQIKVLFYDDLLGDPRAFASDTMQFLGFDLHEEQTAILTSRVNTSRMDTRTAELVRGLCPALLGPRILQFSKTLDRLYPNLAKPSWLTSCPDSSTVRFVEAQRFPDGKALFFVDGRYVYGPWQTIRDCETLEELRIAFDAGLGVGIGRFQSEAMMKALISEGLEDRCLLSLAHADLATNDMYLVCSDRLGWNIIFYRDRFFCAHLSTGHFDLRTIPAEHYRKLSEAGQLYVFPTLQEAYDFTASAEPALDLAANGIR